MPYLFDPRSLARSRLRLATVVIKVFSIPILWLLIHICSSTPSYHSTAGVLSAQVIQVVATTMGSFTLQSGKSHAIEPAIGPNGNIEVLSFFPPIEDGVDAAVFDIKDDHGNILLHVSLRPNQNRIVLNARPVNKDWDKEVHVPFKDSLPSSKVAKISILDRNDNYLVTFSDGAGAKYPKLASQANEKASSIAYSSADGRPIISNPVTINTYCGQQASISSANIRINLEITSSTPKGINFAVNFG
ncbi:unnamed protein product [Rhizoctonia solani]|uniref:Galectin domain-containing protein n=1 Tax=Rhizoctonia solani TaxID=456999 RepID=A0A8H3HEG2_9AGAM|nr:unnamed protein product [Rhizoctonia solani]